MGAVVGRLVAAARMPTSASPVPTLKIAPTSGMSAATIEPNMMSSSRSAQARPMTSESGVVRLLPDLAGAAAVLDGQPGLLAPASPPSSSLSRYAASSEAGTTSHETLP